MSYHTLYVLELEDSCWYVGITANMDQRWSAHSSGRGASWTKAHPPIRIYSSRKISTAIAKEEERRVTAELILQHGINKVRGAALTAVRNYREGDMRLVAGTIRKGLDMDYSEACEIVQEMLDAEKDTAQESSHEFDEVGLLTAAFAGGFSFLRGSRSSQRQECSRCGRNNHTRDACYARTHLNGASLVKTSYSGNRGDAECSRCERDSHTVEDCYAARGKNGRLLPRLM